VVRQKLEDVDREYFVKRLTELRQEVKTALFQVDNPGLDSGAIPARGLLNHKTCMIDADNASPDRETGDTLYCQAGTESYLQNVISFLNLQEIDSPAISRHVGGPIGHNPAGQAAQKPSRLVELTVDCGDKTHRLARSCGGLAISRLLV
jgi:hypothetical protein